MNVQGVIKYVYDNRLGKDGMANKFPNFKFKVGEQEIVLWSAILHPAIVKGKNVSVTVQASKKNGSLFVLTKEDKSPMIQELPLVETKPDVDQTVVSSPTIPSIEQLRKMNINQLKSIAISSGIAADTSKMKKNELITLLHSKDE